MSLQLILQLTVGFQTVVGRIVAEKPSTACHNSLAIHLCYTDVIALWQLRGVVTSLRSDFAKVGTQHEAEDSLFLIGHPHGT